MKILFTGGGTGGHIYPALAVADKLKSRLAELDVLFVGTETGLEAEIVPQAGYDLKTIPVEGFPRRLTWRWLVTAGKAGLGLLQANRIISDFNPDIVVGTGGYVAGPTVLAAALRGVPTLIHEQNAYPGLTNRMLARVVDKIALTTDQADQYFNYSEKTVVTGNPVRPEILSKRKLPAYRELDLDPQRKVILIVGGSRGAKSINQALVDIYSDLQTTDWQVIHITGKRDFSWVAEKAEQQGLENLEAGELRIESYLHNMASALAAADLIVSRAGATMLAEVNACGLPAVLIPYPHAAENHQEYNARALEEAGAAEVILDKELTGKKLFRIIKEIVNYRLEEMGRASENMGQLRAADKIIDLILELV